MNPLSNVKVNLICPQFYKSWKYCREYIKAF